MSTSTTSHVLKCSWCPTRGVVEFLISYTRCCRVLDVLPVVLSSSYCPTRGVVEFFMSHLGYCRDLDFLHGNLSSFWWPTRGVVEFLMSYLGYCRVLNCPTRGIVEILMSYTGFCRVLDVLPGVLSLGCQTTDIGLELSAIRRWIMAGLWYQISAILLTARYIIIFLLFFPHFFNGCANGSHKRLQPQISKRSSIRWTRTIQVYLSRNCSSSSIFSRFLLVFLWKIHIVSFLANCSTNSRIVCGLWSRE